MMRASPEKFAEKITLCLPFTPTSDQETAIGKLAAFMAAEEERSVFILRGYAGTGKTNLISALTRALPHIKWRSVLLAPTGRAAKVLSHYARKPAFTIHRKIFRKQTGAEGEIFFAPADNLHKNTVFIVDEASMISSSTGEEAFNSVLEHLFEYVFSGEHCRLILCGDNAQLPPVGSAESPALNAAYLKSSYHLNIKGCELKEVVRQKLESGILFNATSLRILLASGGKDIPKIRATPDVVFLPGEELEDTLQREIAVYGEDQVMIVTRSNKRAVLFNKSFRTIIRQSEDDLNAGDRLMIVKNNYFWLEGQKGEAAFIANGDITEVNAILKREEMYGFNFCDCLVRFPDYGDMPEQKVKLLTDCLYTDAPALTQESQKLLYSAVMADVAHEPSKAMRVAYMRDSPYLNALQVKFSYAVTCHKAQGGQWPVVFIDQGYLNQDMIDSNYIRWLYTAVTRATEKVYLINFSAEFAG
jgi:exodeoxyribonuclease V